MKKAYIFPGQGSQHPRMGESLYRSHSDAMNLFEQANEILGFRITDIMFSDSEEDLKQTRVTQPAVFLHSVVLALTMESFAPDMVAGHSLGEFSALVAARALRFEDGLRLVYARALAMQKACDAVPSTMAAVLGLDDSVVEEICTQNGSVVVPANYNCPGQLVISGELEAVKQTCEALKAAGAKRALLLPVGGAFHSPLMQPAAEELGSAIESTTFHKPVCPIFQNIDALPHTDPQTIKANLMAQLTGPVRWTQTIQNMIADGASSFTEVGPGKVLQGLVKKIAPNVEVTGIE
ncbi:MAG: ACP S-malonyltransferase [Thermaurantimonas sp.]